MTNSKAVHSGHLSSMVHHLQSTLLCPQPLSSFPISSSSDDLESYHQVIEPLFQSDNIQDELCKLDFLDTE